jgi:selenobiotic family peptide radical SAM maturase
MAQDQSIRHRNPADGYRWSSHLQLEVSASGVRLCWRDPVTNQEQSGLAGPDELLGLKIVEENLCVEKLAHEHGLPVAKFYRFLSHLDRKGILKAPAALLRRDQRFDPTLSDEFLTATVFSLQWHLTDACELHCRHCYGQRSNTAVSYLRGMRVLEQLGCFCRAHYVSGEIAMTGGNPFLNPDFLPLYEEAWARGFEVSIMGNPVSERMLERLCEIHKPTRFQVSLEGLEEHNDWIRGRGNYGRVFEYLQLLSAFGVPSAVMLTLTAANLDQVLPLAEELRGRTDAMAFTRLCPSGNGAELEAAGAERYHRFIEDYLQASIRNPVLECKENLINLKLHETGGILFNGCTGFGCGAAFNTVAVLPDGEVHACRKFPSSVGNLYRQSLEEIYFSVPAREYRSGMQACDHCAILHVCGGCWAAAGAQGSPAQACDPFCWK